MTFTFPNPTDTTEFKGDNGITYAWDVDDKKWQVKSFETKQQEKVVVGPYRILDALATLEKGELVFSNPWGTLDPAAINYIRLNESDGNGNLLPDGVFAQGKELSFYRDDEGTAVKVATFFPNGIYEYDDRDYRESNLDRYKTEVYGTLQVGVDYYLTAIVPPFDIKGYVDEADQHLQIQIDELEQEIDLIAPRLDGAQYKYVGAPSVKSGEMHIVSGSFTSATDLVFFNDQALDGTTHGWADLNEGDYLEITDTQEKTKTAENYAMYLVTKAPEGTGMKQIEVALVKGAGAPTVDDILDAKGFQLGGNDINDLDARYIKLGGESETTSSIVVKTPEGKSHNFGLHSQEGSTAFWIKNKNDAYVFSVQNDGRLIAGPESTPFIATKANHLTTKSYVDSQLRSSGSPQLLHSGWNRKYKYVGVKSLDINEFATNFQASTADEIWLFKAYNQDGLAVKVLDYDCTGDSFIELFEWSEFSLVPVLSAGISRISQSSYAVHDAKLSLNRFWAKDGYTFNAYRYYVFTIRGLVARASGAFIDIPDDKFSEVKD